MDNRKTPLFTLAYVGALILSLVVFGIGLYRLAGPGHDWLLLSLGLLAFVVVLATWPIAIGLHRMVASSEGTGDTLAQTLNDRLQQISIMLNTVTEQQLLSDRAKSVAFREKDRDAIRRAIQEEMNRGDWDAALGLADNIESEFGYKGEANRFRDEIFQRRQDAVRRQIQEVVAIIDRHTRSEQWNGALREAERLMGMFPDNEQVKNLPNEIDRRRQEHKKQLLDSWHDAVARHDVDGSIEILKQLDTYLTPVEAEGMQETARQVFKEKLNQLSKQFADSVHEQRWAEAVRVGDAISREFPNTRVAQEVREKMDALKQRASGNPVVIPTTAVAAPASA